MSKARQLPNVDEIDAVEKYLEESRLEYGELRHETDQIILVVESKLKQHASTSDTNERIRLKSDAEKLAKMLGQLSCKLDECSAKSQDAVKLLLNRYGANSHI